MAHDQCDAGPIVSFQPEISLASTELYCLVHKAHVWAGLPQVPKTLTMIIFITGESGDYGKIPANG